jgi:hypothetical protein
MNFIKDVIIVNNWEYMPWPVRAAHMVMGFFYVVFSLILLTALASLVYIMWNL